MKTKSTQPKVIALLRVSSGKEAISDRARQQSVIARTITANNLDVVRTVTLTDVYRKDVLLNPEYQEILRAIETREIDGVVVDNLDRFFRADDIASLALLDLFKQAKAKLYTGNYVHDFTTNDGIFTALVMSMVGGSSMKAISKRAHYSKEEKRKAIHKQNLA